MELDPVLTIIHEPRRLRIMALLWRHRDVSFTAARDALGLTDGNLASHVRRLEGAGLVRSRRVLTRTGFQTRIALTPHGAQRFREYLARLRAFLEDDADPMP